MENTDGNISSSDVSLDMECADFSFHDSSTDESDNYADHSEALEHCGLAPYRHEPYAQVPDDQDAPNEAALEVESRLQSTDWCSCGNCEPMDTEQECLCCQEVERVQKKLQPDKKCITEVKSFDTVVMDEDVLQVAYYNYRMAFGEKKNATDNERFRFMGYRQFVTWVYGYLGKEIRVIIPSCVVRKLRLKFSSDTYTGFKLPTLNPDE